MSSPTVLHVIDGLGTGGAERSLQEMLPAFAEGGLAPEVAIFHQKNEGIERTVREQGTPVHVIPNKGWRDRIEGLSELVSARRPALIHTSLFEADLVGRLVGARHRIPVVSSLVNTSYDHSRKHDPRVNRHKLRLARKLDAWTARTINTGFHAITPAVREDAIISLGLRPDSITVIPRGRSEDRMGRRTPERRAAARRQLNLKEGQLAFVNVGRREYQKAHDVIIDALNQVSNDYPSAMLLVAGRDGNTSAELNAQVARLGLAERVRFLGHTDSVPDLLCAADAFVFPSRFEGLGGSLIEALALEVPIIASDIPAIRYVLADGDAGLLVPPDRPDQLAAAMRRTVKDSRGTAARVAAGRHRFENQFRLEAVSRAMAEWMLRTIES